MAFDNKPTSTPKDFFLHLFNIVTFYIAVVNFIILFKTYINVLFPDPIDYFYGVTETVRTCMAILLISLPAYIFTSWLLGKDLKAMPEKREMGLRKWLVYLTLFLAGITIVVTLIVFLNNFLGGELTARFSLDMLLILLVAVAIFGYYMWDLKRKDRETSKLPRTVAWLVSLFVLAGIALGFLIIGTPSMQRDREMDQRKVSDLNIIQSQVTNYFNQNDRLPVSLDEVKDISLYVECKDPGVCETYEYRVVDEDTFELCAFFDSDSGKLGVIDVPADPYRYLGNWEHPAGRACFERDVEPLPKI
jgi:competence protein ComGC